MSALRIALLGILVAMLVTGCGGEKDKGINSNKEKPKPAEKGG